MNEFAQFNMFVREVVNGIMALSALLLIFIFGRYCWYHRFSLWQNKTTICALAILTLVLGHFFRAFNTWMAFILSNLKVDTYLWLKWTWIWFILSGILIIIGKVGMLFLFAPARWRKVVLGIWIPLCIIIPVLIALATRD